MLYHLMMGAASPEITRDTFNAHVFACNGDFACHDKSGKENGWRDNLLYRIEGPLHFVVTTVILQPSRKKTSR